MCLCPPDDRSLNGLFRNDIFLKETVDTIGSRLQQAMPAHRHRCRPDLHVADNFWLTRGCIPHRRDDSGNKKEDLHRLVKSCILSPLASIQADPELPVTFSEHHIQTADGGHQVGN